MNIVSLVLQTLLGLMFIGGGVTKLAGIKMHVDNFNKWRLPQWFRAVTGLVETAGAIALIAGIWIDSWAAVGGLIMSVTMLGAILTHLRVRDGAKDTMPSVILLLLSLAVLVINWSELAHFPN
ncbi:DoxX family protein [Paenibacillus koleovorans]|uniref:DoxX family protein n=1 Tax=Paenibacillus koleovorans TaxID=121608 RepID=UPI000FD890F6|nr:DoxX family protein [Paenibacillus koleovorans]